MINKFDCQYGSLEIIPYKYNRSVYNLPHGVSLDKYDVYSLIHNKVVKCTIKSKRYGGKVHSYLKKYDMMTQKCNYIFKNSLTGRNQRYHYPFYRVDFLKNIVSNFGILKQILDRKLPFHNEWNKVLEFFKKYDNIYNIDKILSQKDYMEIDVY